MSLAGAIALATQVGAVIDVGKAVVDFVSGALPSVFGRGSSGVAATSGLAGTAARAQLAGTSVGPQAIQAGIGSAIVPIAGALARRVIGPALVAGAVAVTADRDPREVTPLPTITGGGGVRTVTRKQFILLAARANNPGATAKKIIRSARECGIELAAATFGLSVLDVCFLIAQPPTRRSRGISAADMRRTRSTIRKVLTISQQLTALKPAARRKAYARN